MRIGVDLGGTKIEAVALTKFLGVRYGLGVETVALVGIAVFLGHL